MKLIRLINIILLALVISLFINLIQQEGIKERFEVVEGSISYFIDFSEPMCYFNNSGELNEIPIDRCCYEIQKQLFCMPIVSEKFGFRRYTSEFSEKSYLINQKALNYCKKEGYHVETQ
jgi:hypothetical protein